MFLIPVAHTKPAPFSARGPRARCGRAGFVRQADAAVECLRELHRLPGRMAGGNFCFVLFSRFRAVTTK